MVYFFLKEGANLDACLDMSIFLSAPCTARFPCIHLSPQLTVKVQSISYEQEGYSNFYRHWVSAVMWSEYLYLTLMFTNTNTTSAGQMNLTDGQKVFRGVKKRTDGGDREKRKQIYARLPDGGADIFYDHSWVTRQCFCLHLNRLACSTSG